MKQKQQNNLKQSQEQKQMQSIEQSLRQTPKHHPNSTSLASKQSMTLLFLTQLLLSTQLTLTYPAQASVSNPSESLLLAKIEKYIRSTSHLIDKAQALQTEDARYRFKYHLLRQDLLEIADSINRYLNQNKRSQAPRLVTPLVKAY